MSQLPPSTSAHVSWLDVLLEHLSKVGLILLSCQMGMVLAVLNSAPYQMTKDSFAALEALSLQRQFDQEPFPPQIWRPERTQEKGVLRHNPQLAAKGYTLYSAGNHWGIRLIDMEGRVVHEWGKPCSEIFSGAEHLPSWLPDRFVFPRRSHVFSNGDLIALYESVATTPCGCGLVKFDKDSNVIWRLDRHCHHDMSVLEDGGVVVLTHQIRNDPPPGFAHLGSPIIEDLVTVVDRNGHELKSISLLDALTESPFCREAYIHGDVTGDILHANSVSRVSAEFAAQHTGIEEGDILVCLRNLNLLLAVNLKTEKAVWALSGPWNHPHDPDCLPNGNLLIFDNGFCQGEVVGSRVMEFNLKTSGIDWHYAATKERSFRSEIRGCQLLLWNGNVLITESDAGRILEVTRDGEVAWEYLSTERGGSGGNLIPVILGASRVRPESIPFLQAEAVTTPSRQ